MNPAPTKPDVLERSKQPAHMPGPWNKGDSDLPVSQVAVCGGDRDHPTIVRRVTEWAIAKMNAAIAKAEGKS